MAIMVITTMDMPALPMEVIRCLIMVPFTYLHMGMDTMDIMDIMVME